ncbi:MAG: threonine aldolase [Candidatus Atribacteria bacterium]|nr:threonine aldolase [Candidatus Atribacteria bacterium]
MSHLSWIDLRSDTVTHPTEEMLQAMVQAQVGDDVYGDDPTVNLLQEVAAQKMGKEAALFVPSGTFGNQLAILTHTRRGEEIIVPEGNHIVAHEVGAPAVIAGVQLRTIVDDRGRVDLNRLKRLFREEDIHYPHTGLVCLENAHSSGSVVPLSHLREIYKIAHDYPAPVHLDGARIFNAAIFLKVEAKEIAQYADSVMFCLSKGLSAPVGSILAGDKKFIEKARKNRKLMGGGMRQAGYLAAAGLVALEKMTQRLAEDHEKARLLARELEEIEEINIFPDRLDINMVFFTVNSPQFRPRHFVQSLEKEGIKINPPDQGEFRLVTHYWIAEKDIKKVVSTIKDYFQNN